MKADFQGRQTEPPLSFRNVCFPTHPPLPAGHHGRPSFLEPPPPTGATHGLRSVPRPRRLSRGRQEAPAAPGHRRRHLQLGHGATTPPRRRPDRGRGRGGFPAGGPGRQAGRVGLQEWAEAAAPGLGRAAGCALGVGGVARGGGAARPPQDPPSRFPTVDAGLVSHGSAPLRQVPPQPLRSPGQETALAAAPPASGFLSPGRRGLSGVRPWAGRARRVASIAESGAGARPGEGVDLSPRGRRKRILQQLLVPGEKRSQENPGGYSSCRRQWSHTVDRPWCSSAFGRSDGLEESHCVRARS